MNLPRRGRVCGQLRIEKTVRKQNWNHCKLPERKSARTHTSRCCETEGQTEPAFQRKKNFKRMTKFRQVRLAQSEQSCRILSQKKCASSKIWKRRHLLSYQSTLTAKKAQKFAKWRQQHNSRAETASKGVHQALYLRKHFGFFSSWCMKSWRKTNEKKAENGHGKKISVK